MILLCAGWLATGCGTYPRVGLSPARAMQVEQSQVRLDDRLTPGLEERIQALDPTHVSEADVREVLSQAPAPRIILIHGGVQTVIRRMVSFAEFLNGMGYPIHSLTNPGDGTYTFSCYERAELIAGAFAWYYEREGLRPMMLGHSQGGMQIVKVLHRLSGDKARPLAVWNPLTWQAEDRFAITDPLTGQPCPVEKLRVPYASVVGAGGLTRVLPNQWEMNTKLRSIPDSVEEFTGFCKGNDAVGGDYLGYGPANLFKATGTARVRNVWLPAVYSHGALPETKHLLKDQVIKNWLNNYQPSPEVESSPRLEARFGSDTRNILWAAEVWYSIKKHWVLELQNYIRAHRAQSNAR